MSNHAFEIQLEKNTYIYIYTHINKISQKITKNFLNGEYSYI